MAKKAMTKAERKYVEKAVEMGCVLCQRPGEYHHRTSGTGMGQRSSHYHGFCLCADHHTNGGWGTAIHAGIKRWEQLYGSEAEWVKWTQEQVNGI